MAGIITAGIAKTGLPVKKNGFILPPDSGKMFLPMADAALLAGDCVF